VEETFGRNSIIEMDDGKRITVSNVHIRSYATATHADPKDSSSSLKRSMPNVVDCSLVTPEELLAKALADQKKIQNKLDRLYGILD
jgi:hypothetical protein